MPTSPEIDQELFALIHQHRPCKAAKVIADLPPASRAVIEQAIADGIGVYVLVGALRNKGLPSVDPATLRTHVKGECSCRRI